MFRYETVTAESVVHRVEKHPYPYFPAAHEVDFMDEKTAELRDIFVETTGTEAVTEDQEDGPGSLADHPEEADADERLPELVGRMRERYEFASGLDDDTLVRVVRGFYDDEDDEEIAEAIDADAPTVFTARMDLHLVRESDRTAPFSYEDLRPLVVEGAPLAERAAELDADEAIVEHYSQVVYADLRSTRANDRFTDEFAELLTDQDLEARHANDAREDGLKEATEDLETDVSL